MDNLPKKLIEVALPLPEINDASAYDKMPGIGPHPKGIHHWWARLPLPTARAMLFASVVDDPASHPDKFPTEEAQNAERERLFDIVRELMQKKLHEHPEVYAKARVEMLKYTDGKLPPVLDPFAGGGSIPLEAARLGLEAHAADLNPVAVLLNKCNLELIPRWLDRQPVNPKIRENALHKTGCRGAGCLAEDVRYYGRLVRERAIEKIGHLYPKVKLPKEYGGREANVIAWLWARTVKCLNPACGADIPLIRSFRISKKQREDIVIAPMINGKNVHFIVREGKAAKGTVGKKGVTCLVCKESRKLALFREQVKAQGPMTAMGLMPLCAIVDTGRGRVVCDFTAEMAPQIERPTCMDEYDLPKKLTGGAVMAWGFKQFSELFTPRQLTSMVTLSDIVMRVRKDVFKDAKEAGLSDPEAEDYSKAIVTFLSLALDRCAAFNNSLCRWNGNQTVFIFTKQAIPMLWDFSEANFMGEKAVGWATAVDITAESIERIMVEDGCRGKSRQVDASADWNGLQDVVVSTDPPYYDNISYAALSDFYYIWLRRTIGNLHPDIFKTILVPKGPELTAAPDRFSGNKERAKEHFESGFRRAFCALQEKMDYRFPLTVYYAFKQEDETVGSDDNGEPEVQGNGVDRTTGWETLLNALLESGFQITATWPVRCSFKWRMVAIGTNALASYIVLACRARPSDAPQCSRRDFMNELKKELPVALKHLQQGNIAPVDLAQAAIGPGMAIFSRYAKVMESSGRSMTIRTALNLINHVLDEVLAEQEADFDADTRWALAWFDQYGVDEGEFGVAETLSTAKNTPVPGLVEAGIVAARGGKVRLVKRDESPADWDPSADKRLTVWQATQQLIRALDQHGESDAADLLRKQGGGLGENARELSYRLHKICERKGWSSEALAYNSLVLAWPELTRLAQAAPRHDQRKLF